MLSELDSMLHKLVAIVAVVAAADVDAVVVVDDDAIADCSFVAAGDFVADDDHAGLENLNFDNFLYSAK